MVKKRGVLFLLIMVFMINVGFAPYIMVKAEQGQASDKMNHITKRLDSEVSKLLDKYEVPGVEIVLIDQGRMWEKGYGYADKDNKRPMSKDTIFQVGSISKTITAWGVMKLVEQGKIDLDVPIEKYLKRWHFSDSKYNIQGVTVRRLLSHTAGISVQGYDGVEHSTKLGTIEESLAGKVNKRTGVNIIYEPGSKFQYSGGGYAILQLLIEEVSQTPFEKYMEQEILKPLGMNNSSFEYKDEYVPNLAKAYGTLGQTLPNYIFTEKAAAGLYSTANDLAKIETVSMNMLNSVAMGGGVLKAETIKLMTKPVENAAWGLGYKIIDLPNGDVAIGHGGTNRGWRAQMIELQNQGQGLVVLTNSDMGQNIVAEIEAFWIEEQTGKLPGFYLGMQSIAKCTFVAMLILGTMLGVTAILVLNTIVKKKRHLITFSSFKTWEKIWRIVIPFAIAGIWWEGLHGPIIHGWSVAGFLPLTTKNLSILITMWCLMLLVIGLFPKKETKRSSYEKAVV